MTADSSGPDVVLAGAARSGTSSLAAQLGAHPDIDAGKIKESNYFSRNFGRGPEWYEGLYGCRTPGTLRLDASTSYTSPEFPDALTRLAEASPAVFVIYAVRRPTERALSHYLLRSHYFENDKSRNFGAALRESAFYQETSDYSRWLPTIEQLFGDQRMLVVPFEMITSRSPEVNEQICRRLGLSAPPDAREVATTHKNGVVRYRSQTMRRAARSFRQSAAYPWVRHLLGAERLRKTRGLITQQAQLPTADEALASCDDAQRCLLQQLDSRAGQAVGDYLSRQDKRLELDWSETSFAAEHI